MGSHSPLRLLGVLRIINAEVMIDGRGFMRQSRTAQVETQSLY